MAEVVIVGCKLPNGLLLNVDGHTIRINGKARYNMPSPTRKNLNADVEFADGLTAVDKSFWEKWLAEHKDYGPVMSKLIYASPTRDAAIGKAEDTQEVKTGLEPVDPNAIKNVEPTEEMIRSIPKKK